MKTATDSNGSTAIDYREREQRCLLNLAWTRPRIAGCLREHLIGGYHPGEVWYNLNEYPARPLRKPGEYDAQRFAEYRQHGIEIVKIHSEWADWLEICGGDYFTACDPEGLENLCRMAHGEGLRVHLYFSSGYVDYRHRNYNPEWSSTKLRLDECYWRLAMASCRNADWRGYLLQRIAEMLDRYSVDGLYNDCGFHRYFHPAWRPTNLDNPNDLWDAFFETPEHEAAFEDLLGRLHQLLKEKRPAGLMTLHFGSNRRPPIRTKYYDRLYVGEGVRSVRDLCEKTKRFDPYTFLIPDARLGEVSQRAVYAGGLPYLQFPVLYDGYPITGERAFAEGVEYRDPATDHWQAVMKRIRELRSQGASPTYGWWDRVPGDPQTKPIYYDFLRLWRNVASNGTLAFLEAETNLIPGRLPSDLIQSVFVNENVHLVAANHGSITLSVHLDSDAVDAEDARGELVAAGGEFAIAPNDLRVWRLTPRMPLQGKQARSVTTTGSKPVAHEEV